MNYPIATFYKLVLNVNRGVAVSKCKDGSNMLFFLMGDVTFYRTLMM